MGFSWDFGSHTKAASLKISRKFEGGNRYSDPLRRSERDAAARAIFRQVEPRAHPCVPPVGSR
jgi:hypothetical protein